MIRVLYVSSDFCSENDLARALPEHLLNHDVDVDIVVPHVKGAYEGEGPLAERLANCQARVDGARHEVKVLEGRANHHVRVFYMDAPILAKGLTLANDDGIRACAVFAHAVCSWISQSPHAYDIIHCEGLLTALVAPLMRRVYAVSPRTQAARVLVAVSGIDNKGNIDLSWISRMGLPDDLATSEGMEFYGKMSILNGAYLYADALAFPNDSVRKNVENNRGKDIGMEGVLFDKIDRIHTLRVHSNIKVLGPDNDDAIAAKYSAANMAGKGKCKSQLARKLGLKKNPLVAYIGTLNAESGIDLINDILDDLMDAGISLLIAGTGNKTYNSAIESWKDEFEGKITWMAENPSEDKIRKILSASDILLDPAKNNSNLHQLAMRYGCIPVAYAAAANDIYGVKNIEKLGALDNGFTFKNYDADDFYDAAMDALDLYATPDWDTIRAHAMSQGNDIQSEDVTIDETAKDCIRIYETLK